MTINTPSSRITEMANELESADKSSLSLLANEAEGLVTLSTQDLSQRFEEAFYCGPDPNNGGHYYVTAHAGKTETHETIQAQAAADGIRHAYTDTNEMPLDTVNEQDWQLLETARDAHELAQKIQTKMRENYPELNEVKETINTTLIEMEFDNWSGEYKITFPQLRTDHEQAAQRKIHHESRFISPRADVAAKVLKHARKEASSLNDPIEVASRVFGYIKEIRNP